MLRLGASLDLAFRTRCVPSIKRHMRDIEGYYVAYMTPKEQQNRPTPLPVRRALAEVASSLGAWRKLRGVTQAQLADRAGVSRSTIVRMERGDGGVTLENVLRVLRALGVLEAITRALDPYESDVGRLRADERLPERVRPRQLKRRSDG